MEKRQKYGERDEVGCRKRRMKRDMRETNDVRGERM